MSFHLEVLGSHQKQLLARLGPIMRERGFYSAGGTAVALWLGHRRSVDLDWFTGRNVPDPFVLKDCLADRGVPLNVTQTDYGTLHGLASGIRASFLAYPYPLLKPLRLVSQYGFHVADLDDLICMKLAAVTQWGSKKDFVDIYALARETVSLERMLRLYQQKYEIEDVAHVLYALSYFDDADKERMPVMIWKTDWRAIKKSVRSWVEGFSL